MKTTKAKEKKITKFLNGLDLEFEILNYIDIDSIEEGNEFDSILNLLKDNEYALKTEFIYYYDAMKYLMENDTSLSESMAIVHEFGFSTDKINSCMLASLLSERTNEEEFIEKRNEIEEFFKNL